MTVWTRASYNLFCLYDLNETHKPSQYGISNKLKNSNNHLMPAESTSDALAIFEWLLKSETAGWPSITPDPKCSLTSAFSVH
jgi:hypothetical protein